MSKAEQWGTGLPWWRYYEPPRWFPDWLHRLACTHCRGIVRYCRDYERRERRA
jgi:hypothetical protein